MRLWSIHPRYLDSKGIAALWREGLLARKVLRGETKGYRNHPQLDRFKAAPDSLAAIDSYLGAVCDEAEQRGYHFDRAKIAAGVHAPRIDVTDGQIAHEWHHLMTKLETRDAARWKALRSIDPVEAHPLFRIVAGEIAAWER